MRSKHFLLKFKWSWDHLHTEIATFSVEEWMYGEKDFSNILNSPKKVKENMLSKLHEIASVLTGEQCTEMTHDLIGLYEIINREHVESSLTLELKEVCYFYNNNPVPPPPK